MAPGMHLTCTCHAPKTQRISVSLLCSPAAIARVELKALQQSKRTSEHSAARSVYAQDIDPVTELAEWFVSGQPRKEVRTRVTQLMTSGAEGTSWLKLKLKMQLLPHSCSEPNLPKPLSLHITSSHVTPLC